MLWFKTILMISIEIIEIMKRYVLSNYSGNLGFRYFDCLTFRKILNELSSDAPVISVQKIEEESNSSQASQESQEASDAAQNLTVSQGNTVQIQNAGM